MAVGDEIYFASHFRDGKTMSYSIHEAEDGHFTHTITEHVSPENWDVVNRVQMDLPPLHEDFKYQKLITHQNRATRRKKR